MIKHVRPVAVIITLSLILGASAKKHDSEMEHALEKRVLPIHQECDPSTGRCRKGDWIASNIADCGYVGRLESLTLTCKPQSVADQQWTVDVAEGNRCVPTSPQISSDVQFECASTDLPNTRCVCSRDDRSALNVNACKCQYWPDQDIGAEQPAFCTGYYLGSATPAWACCNNQLDSDRTQCSQTPTTYYGGSNSLSYCAADGQLTSQATGGQVKYYFNCGNCECQNSCAMECTNKFGNCGQWLDCFKGCCLEQAQQPRARLSRRQVSEMTFCGNGVCSEDESIETCPTDCCQTENSDQCSASLDLCIPKCCEDSTCCNSALNPGPGMRLWIITIIMLWSYLMIFI